MGYGYPKQEHLAHQRKPLHVLSQDLRLYEPGEDLRRGILVIGQYYGRTPFMRCLQKTAMLVTVAQPLETVEVGAPTSGLPSGLLADHAFLAGETLATHSLLRLLPKKNRQGVLRFDLLGGYGYGDKTYDKGNIELTATVNTIEAFVGGEWRDEIEECDEQYQELLMNAALKTFADYNRPTAQNLENRFLAGYLWAEALVEDLSEEEYIFNFGVPA